VTAGISVDNSIVTDSDKIVESFGKFFECIYQPSIVSDKSSERVIKENTIKSFDLIKSAEIDVPVIKTEDVNRAIKMLKVKTSTGLDNIPNFIMKGLNELLSPILASIFNWSLLQRYYPEHWKILVITPIPKNEGRTLNDYRPISIINVIPKIFEKVIFNIISSRIYTKISKYQHAFLPNKSTVTNLFNFMSDIGPIVKNRGQVDTIYLDLTKAFDKISHECLLNKLYNFGLSDSFVCWFESFLSNRKFKVRFLNSLSTIYSANSGVPQGSNLGPLLFIIYINELIEDISCDVAVYADDIKIYCKIESKQDHQKIQLNLDRIWNWAKINHLLINCNKTYGIIFSRKTNVLKFQYKIGNHVIQMQSNIIDLGVNFDNKLLFNRHVDIILSKVRKKLGMIKWICRVFSNIKTCSTLYCALVRTQLEYADVIWNVGKKVVGDRIESIQLQFLSWLKWKFKLHNSPYQRTLAADLKLISLSHRHTMRELMLFYKVINGYLHVKELPSMRVNTFRTRNFNIFYPTSCDISPLQRVSRTANKYLPEIDFFCTNIKGIKSLFNDLPVN
jgi:hypothetical protein